jgi:hypothetical protein
MLHTSIIKLSLGPENIRKYLFTDHFQGRQSFSRQVCISPCYWGIPDSFIAARHAYTSVSTTAFDIVNECCSVKARSLTSTGSEQEGIKEVGPI